MKKFNSFLKNVIVKYGSVVAGCAFIFVAIAANSSCITAFFEPEEPKGLEKFKKIK